MSIARVAGVSFFLLLMGGCPQLLPITGTSAVDAQISYSVKTGEAPLTVSLSAAASSSRNGGPLTYAWDFDDGGGSNEKIVNHTFTNPGRYVLKLVVTDGEGESDMATLEIRVQGGGAVAVIETDVSSGAVPLTVQFDGTSSVVTDDTVRDHHWNFGDGTVSSDPDPLHTYYLEGVYEVTLTITTAGGLTANTNTTITVGPRNGALQFQTGSLATLPLDKPQTLAELTFEAWVSPEAEGGTVATIGDGALIVDLTPADNTVRVWINGRSAEGTSASIVSDQWLHVAVVFSDNTTGDEDAVVDGDAAKDGAADSSRRKWDTAGGGSPGGGGPGSGGADAVIVYIDAVPVINTTADAPLDVEQMTIGGGLRGRIGEVRLWDVLRSSSEVYADHDQRASGTESNLTGYWPLTEGSGQTLDNEAGTLNGTLGRSTEVEAADPAWSTQGPPV